MKIYKIFDINASLLSDYPVIEAKNSRQAIQKYLDSKDDKSKFIRSGDSDVDYKAQPFYIENGMKYRDGKAVWFKKIIREIEK